MSIAPEHAEVNIRTPGLYATPNDINKTALGTNLTKYQPTSINRVGIQAVGVPNVTGQIEFNFTTSNMQWVDLFNSFFLTRYEIQDAQDLVKHLTQNMIGQAYLFINGIQVAFTNNWTVASRVNKRMQFSKQYNMSMHDMTYRSDVSVDTAALLEAAAIAGGYIKGAAGDAGVGAGYNNALDYPILQPQGAGVFTDKEHLDGFFIRDRNSCWIPPNSQVRITLVVDPLYPKKAARTPDLDPKTKIGVQQIELVMPSVIKKDPPPAEYILQFITNTITTQQVPEANCNKNLTVDPNIVKVAIAFQSTLYATDAKKKTAGGEVLSYPLQNEKAGRFISGDITYPKDQLDSLQLQLGSIVTPAQAYDFNLNFHREAYEAYMHLTGKTLSFESQESFMDWLTEPIYLFDFPRAVADKSTNLIVRAQRKRTIAEVQMHIIEMDQQLVRFEYDPTSGAVISTTTLK